MGPLTEPEDPVSPMDDAEKRLTRSLQKVLSRTYDVEVVIIHRFDRLEARQANLEVRQASLEEKVSGIQQDVSSLQQDVSSLQQDVSSLKQDVAFIKNFLEEKLPGIIVDAISQTRK